MSDYKGITQDTLFLMQLNRFNDSKAFYEENKEKIKANMTVPMRQIAASLSDMMLDIDPFMNTVPTKMVSRVRRDTRYTHDKHLYRENMWIMFMRPKKEWHMYPCMWFEVTPGAWSCRRNIRSLGGLYGGFQRASAKRPRGLQKGCKIGSFNGSRARYRVL